MHLIPITTQNNNFSPSNESLLTNQNDDPSTSYHHLQSTNSSRSIDRNIINTEYKSPPESQRRGWSCPETERFIHFNKPLVSKSRGPRNHKFNWAAGGPVRTWRGFAREINHLLIALPSLYPYARVVLVKKTCTLTIGGKRAPVTDNSSQHRATRKHDGHSVVTSRLTYHRGWLMVQRLLSGQLCLSTPSNCKGKRNARAKGWRVISLEKWISRVERSDEFI